MSQTVVSSATREVVIGFDRPFVMIGERINPTGRKLLAEEMKAGDFSRVEADAVAQVAAGAHMLDVNAGVPLADEPALLARAVQLVQSVTDVPLSIDSSIVEALEAGLAVYQGKPLVNSVTGEDEVLERVLPLVARHGAAVVAISNDETGISEDIDVRFAVARKIVERAADHGIPAADVVVDPLVMPIGALGQAGQQAFSLIRRLREELKVNTTCGASNISFGLPNRQVVTGTFLAMAIGAGMTSAIMSPLHPEVKAAVMAADVLAGNDRDCAAWIRANRDPNAPTRRAAATRSARSPLPGAAAVDDMTTPPRRVHPLRAGGQGRRRNDGAGGSPRPRRRPRHGVRRARHLRPLPGHAERGSLRQVGDRRRAARPRAAGLHRGRLPRQPPARRRQPTRLRGSHRRRRRGRRAGGQPGPPPGRAQGSRPRPDRRRPGVPPVLRRGAGRPVGRGRERRPCRSGGRRPPAWARRCRRDRPRAAALVASPARRRRRSDHRRRARAARRVRTRGRHLARLRRRRPRHRRRRRLDDDRRPPLRSRHGRGAGVSRADEPADPLRRGPDEPGVLRDDEPRRRSPADRRGARGHRRARRRAGRGGRQPARPRAGGRPRRQPDHAPHRPRHRPDAARPGAVRAGDRRGRHRPCERPRPRPAQRHRLRRAVHRRPCRRRHRRSDPRRGTAPRRVDAAAGRRRHQRRDRAR